MRNCCLPRSLNSFLTVTGKFSVMIGTLVYVFGSCEHHSKLQIRKIHPFKTDNVSINWATDRNRQTKQLDTWLVTQLTLLRQESVKNCHYDSPTCLNPLHLNPLQPLLGLLCEVRLIQMVLLLLSEVSLVQMVVLLLSLLLLLGVRSLHDHGRSGDE